MVDGIWVLIGSANLDPRSLHLNFEFNVEVYDPALAGRRAGLEAVNRFASSLAAGREFESLFGSRSAQRA